MISSISEVRQVRDIVRRVARRLKRRGVAIADPLPPLGVMVEVPGAALAADALAGVADFFAIGTNDLTMYNLAIDRAEERSEEPTSELQSLMRNPYAVFRLKKTYSQHLIHTTVIL